MKKVNNIFEHTDCISEETLLKYISDQLSPAEKHKVEKHFIDCEMCSDAVEGLRILSDSNRISGITSELNQKIQKRVERKKGRMIFLEYRTQFAAVAGILLLVGLFFFFRNNFSAKKGEMTGEKVLADKVEPKPNEPKSPVEEGPSFKQDAKSDLQTESREQKVATGKAQEHIAFTPPAESGIVLAEKAPSPKQEEANKSNAQTQPDYYRASDDKEGKLSKSAEEDIPVQDASAVAGEKLEQKEYSFADEDKKVAAQSAPASTVNSNAEVVTASGSASSSNQSPAKKHDTGKDQRELDSVSVNEKNVDGYIAVSENTKTKSNFRKEKESKPSAQPNVQTKTSTTSAIQTDNANEISRGDATIAGNISETTAMDKMKADSTKTTSASPELSDALQSFNKEDYKSAASEYEKILAKNPNDYEALYYSAVSYYKANQSDKAIKNFNKVLENKSGKHFDDAQWYLSLAYIQSNDIKKARRNLVELKNNSNSRYKAKAAKQLDEIKTKK